MDSCLPCVRPRWERYIEQVIPAYRLAEHLDCWLPLRKQIESKINPFVKILEQRPLHLDSSQPHFEARTRIARRVLDALIGNAQVPVELPPSAEFMSEHELNSEAYQWVICTKNGTGDQATLDRFRTTAATQFGPGIELEMLSEAALQDIFRTKAGAAGGDSVEVCIGVVYSRKVHSTSDPFVVDFRNRNEAARLVTNKRSVECVDAVVFTPRKAQEAGRKYFITWEAGAAVPLAMLKVQQLRECKVCMESCCVSDGFTCPKNCGTFTCWECLQQSYTMAARPDAIQGGTNLEGELLCSDTKCRCPITVGHFSSGATPAVLEAQQELKMKVIMRKEIQKALDEQKKQIEAEYARIEQIKDENEKVAAKLRLRIVNDVLTLRCPRCKAAFVEFEGCFAIKCIYNNCGCGFCAWCLKDCGRDAHEHVLQCPEREANGYFHTEDVFNEHHRKRKTLAVKKIIKDAGLNHIALKMLRDAISVDLMDLQIPQSDVFPAAGAGAGAGAGAVRAAAPAPRQAAAPRQAPAGAAAVGGDAGGMWWGGGFNAFLQGQAAAPPPPQPGSPSETSTATVAAPGPTSGPHAPCRATPRS